MGIHGKPQWSTATARAADVLDLHPTKDDQLMWIAEHAAVVDLPEPWQDFEDANGEKAYYHPKTKFLTKEHPIMSKYKKFVTKVRKFQERNNTLDKKVVPHLAVILNEVLNRVYKDLPPVTPDIIERLAILLYIDSEVEYFLTRRMKHILESYAEDQYDVAIQAHQKVDPTGFLNEIREDQIRVEVLTKPEVVIMCTEIERQPARVKCEQCKDFFSFEGFQQTHSTGKRKQHTTLKCEQVTCSVYTNQLATCEVDHQLFCERAYEEVAEKNPEIRQKRKKVLGGLKCSEYPQKVAEVLCEDCSDLFCWEAFIELHRRGNRARHIPLKLNDEGQLFRSGVELSPEENARLIDRARHARDGGPWLSFQDDRLNTYWYHLTDKAYSTDNKYL
jgi:hypothetical protein